MMLSYACNCHKSNMAATDRKWIERKHNSNKIPAATPMFRGQTTGINNWACCPMSGYVVKQTGWPLTGSRWDITYITARIYDSNEIPMAIPMCPGSGNVEKLLRIQSYVRAYWKSKMWPLTGSR